MSRNGGTSGRWFSALMTIGGPVWTCCKGNRAPWFFGDGVLPDGQSRAGRRHSGKGGRFGESVGAHAFFVHPIREPAPRSQRPLLPKPLLFVPHGCGARPAGAMLCGVEPPSIVGCARVPLGPTHGRVARRMAAWARRIPYCTWNRGARSCPPPCGARRDILHQF